MFLCQKGPPGPSTNFLAQYQCHLPAVCYMLHKTPHRLDRFTKLGNSATSVIATPNETFPGSLSMWYLV